MSDFTDKVMRQAKELDAKIFSKKKIIAFSRFVKEKNFNRQCAAIFDIQVIIRECLQSGNYRRACRYIIVGNRIIKHIEQHEKQIIKELTNIIVKD